MSIRAKWIALMVAVVVMLVGMQVYYGRIDGKGSQSASPETTFDWWIYSGTSSEYYGNYAENPAIQYTLRKTWGPEEKGIALSFLQPPPGSEADNYATMIASGDLPDIIDAVICDPPAIMVEKGYAIELTDSGKVIGNIYCGKRDFAAREVGYIVNKRYQQKGYAAEALSAVIAQAFNDGAHRVYAECDARNVPSWKLLEKVGLRREAYFRRNIWFHRDEDGEPIWKDTLVYAILEDEAPR